MASTWSAGAGSRPGSSGMAGRAFRSAWTFFLVWLSIHSPKVARNSRCPAGNAGAMARYASDSRSAPWVSSMACHASRSPWPIPILGWAAWNCDRLGLDGTGVEDDPHNASASAAMPFPVNPGHGEGFPTLGAGGVNEMGSGRPPACSPHQSSAPTWRQGGGKRWQAVGADLASNQRQVEQCMVAAYSGPVIVALGGCSHAEIPSYIWPGWANKWRLGLSCLAAGGSPAR